MDLGCNHPTYINNTYVLERDYGWSGVSVDIDPASVAQHAALRSSTALVKDCTGLTAPDFDQFIQIAGTDRFDYLSLDLEPAESTLKCLLSIPMERVEFSLITFEHEFFRYADGERYRSESRRFLEGHGYRLICKNIANDNCVYEDWYFNPKSVDYDRIRSLESDGKNWNEVLFT